MGACVGAFSRVHDERPPLGCLAKALSEVGAEIERMRPSEALRHANREALGEDVGLAWVVVANGGDAAEQVLQPAPEQPQFLWYTKMVANWREIRMINIAGPLCRIGIGAASEARKQVELQMVMRIDQPRQNHVTAEVQPQVPAIQSHGLVQMPIQTAGMPLT